VSGGENRGALEVCRAGDVDRRGAGDLFRGFDGIGTIDSRQLTV
jgi:hypothetical protein